MEVQEGTHARRGVPHKRRSDARGEALWTPVGDRATDGHAAGLLAATSCRRKDGPFSSIRWAR